MAFILKRAEEVAFFRSTLIDCKHAFSTRIGGVSTLAHTSSLNLAFGRGDEDETVLENLKIFAKAVGIDAESIVSRVQIHSNYVFRVGGENRGEGYFRPSEIECDGYVTNEKGIALGVKTADCVPILLYAPQAQVIGAAHAGWRGTASGIVRVCIDKMCELGAERSDIRAAIGASICVDCYEVGEDLYDSVKAQLGRTLADEFVKPQNGKLHADLIGLNHRLLLECGLKEQHIDVTTHCTCHEPSLFYSHRYSNGKRGTMLSVISLQ